MFKLEPFAMNASEPIPFLDGIFKYQRHLISQYEELRMVPDLDSFDYRLRDHQYFLKTTISNIIEELVEADQVFDKILELIQTPVLEGMEKDLLASYSEELADTLHFFIELLIYSGIQSEDVAEYYKISLKEKNLLSLYAPDGLTTGLRFGRHLNCFQNPLVMLTKQNARVIQTEADYEKNYYAGYIVHPGMDSLAKEYNWHITKNLKLAANFLKNREWTQGERSYVNILEFQRKVMEAWSIFMGFLDMQGWDTKGIYIHYERKNLINQQRLKDKY